MEFCEWCHHWKWKLWNGYVYTFILNIYESVHPPWLYTFCVLSVLFTYTSYMYILNVFSLTKYLIINLCIVPHVPICRWCEWINWIELEAYYHNTKNKFKFYFLIITEIIRKEIISLNFAIMKKYIIIVIPQRGFVIERKNRNYIKIN